MASRSLVRAVAWALVFLAPLGRPAAAHAQAPGGRLTLEQALATALEANPALVAARLRRTVDLAGVAVARERLNPDFVFEAERETPREAYTLDVPVETGGKRRRRIAVAEATVRTGEAEIARITTETRNHVRRAYYTLAIAQLRVTLLEDLRALADRARQAASDRFEAGAAPRLEVLQAQLGLAQIDNEVATASGTLVATRGELNVLLARAADSATAVVADLDTPPPSVEIVTARAVAANAELAVLDRRIDEAEARLALAKALRLPDAIVATALTHRSEPEFLYGWRVGLTLTLPVLTRHRAGVRVEESSLAQLRAERDARLAALRGEVFAAGAQAAAHRQQFLRYRDEILPQALEVERMAQESYRLGQTGLTALLQALQAARDVRLRSLEAGLDYQLGIADLERAMGVPLQ